MEKQPTNPFEILTAHQMKCGYAAGEINPVALFGLFGEAGEVMQETVLRSKSKMHKRLKKSAELSAQLMDDVKKKIRDGKCKMPSIEILPENVTKFDIELADVLYYINALAINRGKTLADYAEIIYKKITGKPKIDVSLKPQLLVWPAQYEPNGTCRAPRETPPDEPVK